MGVDKNKQESSRGKLIDQYSEVFKEDLGTFKGPKEKIQVELEAHQSFKSNTDAMRYEGEH